MISLQLHSQIASLDHGSSLKQSLDEAHNFWKQRQKEPHLGGCNETHRNMIIVTYISVGFKKKMNVKLVIGEFKIIYD